jgi:hypothetical protein
VVRRARFTQEEHLRKGLFRLSLLAAALALAVCAAVLLAPRSEASGQRARVARPDGAAFVPLIERARHRTWRWQALMGIATTRTAASFERVRSFAYRRRVWRLWARRAARAEHEALHPPHRAAWLCIHRYEGSWSDPDPPYYGGLQMDLGFQRTYGGDLLRRKGTADHWTPLEQMWVAERAYRRGRGFYPWPSTARYCGLI